MIIVRFFARIRERLGVARLELAPRSGIGCVADVRRQLVEAHGGQWQAELSADNVVTAVNHEVCDDAQPVADGDEVAFYPPVTGG